MWVSKWVSDFYPALPSLTLFSFATSPAASTILCKWDKSSAVTNADSLLHTTKSCWNTIVANVSVSSFKSQSLPSALISAKKTLKNLLTQ